MFFNGENVSSKTEEMIFVWPEITSLRLNSVNGKVKNDA